jgi:hypothetical protein
MLMSLEDAARSSNASPGIGLAFIAADRHFSPADLFPHWRPHDQISSAPKRPP